MIGYPEHLNTKQDYLNCRDMVLSGRLPAEPLGRKLQSLIDTQKHYVFDKTLAVAETPAGTDPACRVVVKKTPDGAEKRRQFLLKKNPGCALKKLGFSVFEVNTLMTETGG